MVVYGVFYNQLRQCESMSPDRSLPENARLFFASRMLWRKASIHFCGSASYFYCC